eukprot:14742697-Ditylum_brightwellii.AAC.1
MFASSPIVADDAEGGVVVADYDADNATTNSQKSSNHNPESSDISTHDSQLPQSTPPLPPSSAGGSKKKKKPMKKLAKSLMSAQTHSSAAAKALIGTPPRRG